MKAVLPFTRWLPMWQQKEVWRADLMAAVLDVLRQDGVRVRFRQQTVSLEDAFIHHIGALNEGFE